GLPDFAYPLRSWSDLRDARAPGADRPGVGLSPPFSACVVWLLYVPLADGPDILDSADQRSPGGAAALFFDARTDPDRSRRTQTGEGGEAGPGRRMRRDRGDRRRGHASPRGGLVGPD